MWDQQSFRSACASAQSDQSLCLSLEYSMTSRLLTEQHLEFLSLTGGYTGSSESTLVKMPHCWKSHVVAEIDLSILKLTQIPFGRTSGSFKGLTMDESRMWSVLFCFRVRLFIDALWTPAGIGLTSWLSFVMSYCEVVTFPLVSWVRCGA